MNGYEALIPLSKEEKERICREATIILDTNVLLEIHRCPKTNRDLLISLLKTNKERIYITEKIFEEYLSNQEKVSIEANNNLFAFRKNFEENQKLLDTTLLENEIKSIHEQIIKAMDEYQNNGYEIFKQVYYEIIDGHVFVSDKAPGNNYEEECKKRFEDKIPPGYMDSKKDNEKKYSDCIIWLQIIELANKKEGNDFVFITNDEKEDWLEKAHGKIIGPRKELLKEFYTKTSGKKILFYNTLKFIEYFTSTPKAFSIDAKALENLVNMIISNKKKFRKTKRVRIRRGITTEYLLNWWYKNYKDPVNGVPWASKEGGYQYYLGGTYDAEEEIRENFPFIKENILKEVLEVLNEDSFEWVKIGEY